MKREERNETKKRNERGASCRVNTLVEYTCEPSSRVNRGRRKKQRERESWSRFSDGRSAVCSQENGSRGYRWCSIDGGATPRVVASKKRKEEASRIWIGKDGERGVKEGRPWNHLIGDFASRPSIRWRYRIGSGRLRQVMATALLRFPPTCRGKRAEMRKIVAGAPLIARSLRGHACTRTDARVGDGNV